MNNKNNSNETSTVMLLIFIAFVFILLLAIFQFDLTVSYISRMMNAGSFGKFMQILGDYIIALFTHIIG